MAQEADRPDPCLPSLPGAATVHRQHYEAIRLAVSAVKDALDSAARIAARIAGRSAECFDGTELGIVFQDIRAQIVELEYRSPAMTAAVSALHAARAKA